LSSAALLFYPKNRIVDEVYVVNNEQFLLFAKKTLTFAQDKAVFAIRDFG